LAFLEPLVKIRWQLNALEDSSIRRLADFLSLSGRTVDDQRSAIARFYRGDMELFHQHLAREDLEGLLSQTPAIAGITYCLPDTERFSLATLRAIAIDLFRDRVFHPEMVDEEELEDYWVR
jgi:hypothetical protein